MRFLKLDSSEAWKVIVEKIVSKYESVSCTGSSCPEEKSSRNMDPHSVH